MTVSELFARGGVTMYPLLGLSLLAVGVICDRLWFWGTILFEKQVAKDVLAAAASFDWELAAQLSLNGRKHPVGRLLHAPLRYPQLEPEAFCLALETVADEELMRMRQGEKVLEAAIALAPLLGLLGTVLGLMQSLNGIDLAQLSKAASAEVTAGISASLISTATGLGIAIISLAFYRLFQSFLWQQAKMFRRVGNQLELLYRQYWSEIKTTNYIPIDSEIISDSSLQEEFPNPVSRSPLNYEDLFGE